MRWLWLGVLASCYRPNGYAECAIACVETVADPCPPGLHCLGGSCKSAADVTCPEDALPMDDGPPPDQLIPASACAIDNTWTRVDLFPIPSGAGRGSFTTDLLASEAVFDIMPSAMHEVRIGPANMPLPGAFIADDSATLVFAPRLSPEGTDIYFQNGTMPAVMSRPSGTWLNPRQLTVFLAGTQVLMTGLMSPGTPMKQQTVGLKRRMMMQNSNAFWELEENLTVPDRWDVLKQYIPGNLGLTEIEDPQLSPDGLRLVFNGRLNAGAMLVRVADRANLAAPFTASINLDGVPISVRYPFLASNCRLYARQPTGEVGIVVLQRP